ncbi:hypothetical protein E4L95_14545 [Paracoccus liaowanqingii]|uniref:Uncharacterized protein n=1 Tax=Paracoccus liaowanqingii TaxID=2560053 RepID=A0A4Z1BJ13_9RHOB|nr:ankyrin repeat domain-containing protein [Paracoccus liaowanqingii]TGN55950.1 hypothetical protein E4L95_14545 [Paracoccus liaowanqingii]
MNLETSIRAGDLTTTLDCLRSGAHVNQRGPDGMTPLMIASARGQSQMVDLLLTAGADVLAVEPRMGASALHKSAHSGNGDVVTLLLDAGAFIDLQSPVLGNTPLMDAVLHKQKEAVLVLLRRGARTPIRNHWQQTALELAEADGLFEIVRQIEARGKADAEQRGSLQLLAASKAGDLAEVERLLATGAFIEERAQITGTLDDDYTPLGIAVREGHATIVRKLLDEGADPRRVIGLMRGTPVHEAAFLGRAEILRMLTEPHTQSAAPVAELDAQGPYNGLTALHDAVWHGHLEAAKVIVDAGARLDLKTHAGFTPRELATLYGYRTVAQFLAAAEQA